MTVMTIQDTPFVTTASDAPIPDQGDTPDTLCVVDSVPAQPDTPSAVIAAKHSDPIPTTTFRISTSSLFHMGAAFMVGIGNKEAAYRAFLEKQYREKIILVLTHQDDRLSDKEKFSELLKFFQTAPKTTATREALVNVQILKQVIALQHDEKPVQFHFDPVTLKHFRKNKHYGLNQAKLGKVLMDFVADKHDELVFLFYFLDPH